MVREFEQEKNIFLNNNNNIVRKPSKEEIEKWKLGFKEENITKDNIFFFEAWMKKNNNTNSNNNNDNDDFLFSPLFCSWASSEGSIS